MELNTASAVISFAKELEDKSSRFYEDLARLHGEAEDLLLSFVKENRQNNAQKERVYYGVISDAIEGCFSFEGIDTENYIFQTRVPEDISYADAVRMATAMEDKIAKFYLNAAKTSKSLLADIPELLEKLARKRKERIVRLKSLIDGDKDGSK